MVFAGMLMSLNSVIAAAAGSQFSGYLQLNTSASRTVSIGSDNRTILGVIKAGGELWTCFVNFTSSPITIDFVKNSDTQVVKTLQNYVYSSVAWWSSGIFEIAPDRFFMHEMDVVYVIKYDDTDGEFKIVATTGAFNRLIRSNYGTDSPVMCRARRSATYTDIFELFCDITDSRDNKSWVRFDMTWRVYVYRFDHNNDTLTYDIIAITGTWNRSENRGYIDILPEGCVDSNGNGVDIVFIGPTNGGEQDSSVHISTHGISGTPGSRTQTTRAVFTGYHRNNQWSSGVCRCLVSDNVLTDIVAYVDRNYHWAIYRFDSTLQAISGTLTNDISHAMYFNRHSGAVFKNVIDVDERYSLITTFIGIGRAQSNTLKTGFIVHDRQNSDAVTVEYNSGVSLTTSTGTLSERHLSYTRLYIDRDTFKVTLVYKDGGTLSIREFDETEGLWEPTTGILDAYSSAVGAYALRHLFGSYTGPHIRIRRSSDSAEADIWFDEYGTLQKLVPTTNTLYITDLVHWLGGAAAYVTTWYDQSGQGNHGTQTSTSAQPSLDAANSWISFDSNDYFNLPDGTVPSGDSRYTLMAYHGSINSDGGILGSGNYGNGNETNAFRRQGSGYNNYWWGNDLVLSSGYAANQTVAFTYDQAVRRAYINGSQVASLSGGGRNSGSGNNTIGVTNNNGNEYLNGQLNSVLIWNIALSGGDVSSISQAVTS